MGSLKLTRSISLDSTSNFKISEEDLSMKQRVVETSYSDVSSFEFNDDSDDSDNKSDSNEMENIRDNVNNELNDSNKEKFNKIDHENSMSISSSTSSENLDNHSNSSLPDNGRGLPSSCIFVASLTASLSDDKLCLSVKNRFKEFGELNGVKVLRDQENRPYAFVQYNNDHDATRALENAHGTILDGRVIRCEPARVNRTLFITNANPVSYIDIKQLCGSFGKLEQLVPNKDKNQFSQRYSYPVTISNSWFIRFVYRDDAIRAFANLKMDSHWTVQWAQNVNVPRRFNMLFKFEENNGQELPDGNDNNRSFSKKEEMHDSYSNSGDHQNNNITIDKKSIFVGQLPKETTSENIKEHFAKYGTIVDVNLIHKPTNVFTFIQFDTEKAAAAALEKENHSTFLEKTIHVQYKELGGYHGKRVFRRNSNYAGNNHRSNHFSGPQLNLAPPPISMYRRHSSDMNPVMSYGNPNMVTGNTAPNGSLSYLHCMPPNLPHNGVPNFDGNMYPYMNGSLPHNFRRGSMPDNWMASRRELLNKEHNSNTTRSKRSESKKQEADNTLRTTDTMTEIASDVSDSLDKGEGTHAAVNSTTTYNNSSAGSMVNDYKNRIERMGLTKSRNGSNDSIEYNDPVNPYLFQHYYYPPLPYHMGNNQNSQGAMQSPPYMMYYPLPPQGMPISDGPLVPMNFQMNMKANTSGAASPNGFTPYIPPQPPRDKEYLDY